jgi:hypothetical protein
VRARHTCTLPFPEMTGRSRPEPSAAAGAHHSLITIPTATFFGNR